MPCSIGFQLISTFPQLQHSAYESFTGKDVGVRFLSRLLEIEEICMEYLFDNKRLIMSESDKENFAQAKKCYICNRPFPDPDEKVRDHDHYTGVYRGAAHNSCNLLLRKTYKIPIFFHNFRGYDSHLIASSISKFPDIPIQVIGQGMEKYLTLSWGDHIVFKDSLQFMGCALETLASNLAKGGKSKFPHLISQFAENQPIDLLLRKGIYPYDYVNNWDKFDENKLPARSDFASKLKQKECSEEDYKHAETVWNAFACQKLLDYHELYMKTDVLLLADVFEVFRNVCMTNYGLDPAHYVSAPQLSWDAMLKNTECELQLISDPEMFRMLDKGIRGGICMISKRYAKANNKYLGELYDKTKPTSYIIYLDANNLYGWAMSQTLPTDGFYWLVKEEWEDIKWIEQTEEQDIGYIIECDLEYPKELHNSHNDYPLAPERMDVAYTLTSENQMQIRKCYSMSQTATSTKLIPNLLAKTKYCCHYLLLKFYLEHGLILGKVHRVLTFNQSKWLAPYIAKNQNLRAESENDFEKEYFKLMNNAVYGKTCENQKNHTDIRLVTTEKQRKKYTEKPHCLGFRIFDENLAAIEMRKLQALINKPFYVGFSVLELSKLHMYRFHYDYIKRKYNDKAELLFTDTDSLMYEVQTEDIYNDMWEDRELFDFAGYSDKSKYYDKTNNKVIGKFKDETSGNAILEFVGLRPKMYSFRIAKLTVENQVIISEKHRSKGIQYAASEKLRHENYLSQLFEPAENYLTNRRIASKLHKIYSHEINKRALCAYDDKRFILDDSIHTLAYGHKDITDGQAKEILPPQEAIPIVQSALQMIANKNNLQSKRDFPAGQDPMRSVLSSRLIRASAKATLLKSTSTIVISKEPRDTETDLEDELYKFYQNQRKARVPDSEILAEQESILDYINDPVERTSPYYRFDDDYVFGNHYFDMSDITDYIFDDEY